MKIRTNEEKQIILDYILKKISEKEALQRYPHNLESSEYILSTIGQAKTEKNAEDLECSFYLLAFNSKIIFQNEFIDLLIKLLREEWHYQHENMVMMLQEIKSRLSIDVLYETTFAKFDYLNYDDTYSLGRKCVHALGDINTEESKEKLRLIVNSNIAILKEKAEKQLYYYKR
jgi:hypothetical protein